jgi:transposase-like protein
MWRYVYEAVGELKKADQLALFKAMKQDLYPKEENKMGKLLPKIKESRFSSGLCCLHCGKTFNDMTNTPFSGSRYPEKWIKYIKMMINGVTLPKISDSLKIHISTAFYWRHKILNALGSHGFN